MSTEPQPAAAQAALVEQLVAYLDGELDSGARRVLEQRLAEDDQCRQTLRQLQRSWDLLDELPRAEADEAFTHSTLTIVTVAAKAEADRRVAARRRSVRIARGIAAGGAVAACLAGYVVVSWFAERGNRQLLRDLPVVQQVDEYRYAGNLEFLRMLEKEGLFVEEPISDELQ